MMVKITTGSSFGGAIKYDEGLLGKEQVYETIGFEGIDMDCDSMGRFAPNVQDITDSFEMQAALNPNVSQPVKHFAISWHPDDAAILTNKVMTEAVRQYLKEMGYDNTQYLITRHLGTDNPHCHVVVNAVDNDGKKINDYMERKRSADICKKITNDMGFTWGSHKSAKQSEIPTDCRQRTYEAARYEIARDVACAIPEAKSIKDLPAILMIKYRVTTDLKLDSNGRPCGISFSKQVKDENGNTVTCRFSGSKIDRQYSCKNLENIINIWHDFPRLRQEAQKILDLHSQIRNTHEIPTNVRRQCEQLRQQMHRLSREERRLQKSLPLNIAKGALAVMMAIAFSTPLTALVTALTASLVVAYQDNRLSRIQSQRADIAKDIKSIKQTFRPQQERYEDNRPSQKLGPKLSL
ncbi:MAG: relaxase/mobilization nuclease domain-containing protein [Bacteroidales bacterium]|nr:relaxase/mobilization nuclease domain-containing protein [Bacteroidales bacterium]